MNFWNYVRDRSGINDVGHRLTAIEDELAKLRKKVVRKPKRYDQIERGRSRAAHPSRHH
ncbi:hypothetical protein LCGC14_2410680 [marine sediment metagenome]|uniref:Uncharacterized protein n=1 Tax=marine sediment metagenome TaxID=412755 RepID=A0A0F9BSN3_9ZZZZ